MKRLILTALLSVVALVAPGAHAVSAQDAQPKPEFTPFTVAPRLLNREEVRDVLAEEYPPELREAGIGGRVNLWFYITAQGRVQYTQLDMSSGVDAIDQAALRVADVYRFSPALNEDEPVAVWVSLPITFTPRRDGGR